LLLLRRYQVLEASLVAMKILPCRAPENTNHNRGFTLLESLIILAVIGILISLAIPSVQGLMRNASLTARANATLALLMQARQRAVYERRPVIIEASEGSFAGAMRVFVDLDEDGQFSEPDTLLTELEAAPGSLHAQAQPALNSTSIRFDPTGMLAEAPIQMLLLCGDGWASENDDRYARTVIVHGAGRAEIVRGSALFGGCAGALP